ncbi:hypothetical protein L7F22_017329, partial [Adiantum nelumboides]|nr:hypothetical protein [Adiantum nelumboides]
MRNRSHLAEDEQKMYFQELEDLKLKNGKHINNLKEQLELGGSNMFNVKDDLVDDAFGGVFLEMNSMPVEPRSRESMPMAAYVDRWLDAQ